MYKTVETLCLMCYGSPPKPIKGYVTISIKHAPVKVVPLPLAWGKGE